MSVALHKSHTQMPLSRKLRALGATFTPTRGAVGSAFALTTGIYVRTPWGTMRVRPEVGMSLIFRQKLGRFFKSITLAMLLVILATVLL